MNALFFARYSIMNAFIENIRVRYRFVLPGVYFFFLYHAILTLTYRILTYGTIREIFRGAGNFGFIDYLSLSFPWDAAAILAVTVFICIVLMALAGMDRGLFAVPLLVYGLVAIVTFLSVEFFRIFETAFQTRFVGEEHFTGIAEMLKSAFAEISIVFYLSSIVAIAVCCAGWFFVFRHRDGWESIPVPLSMALRIAFPVMLVILFIVSLFRYGDSRYVSRARQMRAEDTTKTANLLREQSSNPLLNFFVSPTSREHVDTSAARSDVFSFKFKTDSLESSRRYGRMSAIPRGKRYNIVLFFFESLHSDYLNLSVKGKPVTPQWHRLMRNSIVYKNHYSNHPLSANALFTILSSAYDLSSKDLAIKKHPGIDIRILPQILKDRGYATFLIHTANLEYARQDVFLAARGFDRILADHQLKHMPPYNKIVGWSYDERCMVKPALDFIKENKGKPSLLVFLPINPHHPYAIPDRSFRITDPISEDTEHKQKEWLKYVNSLYYSDYVLGQLIDAFEAEGLGKDTLFFIFGDHGEAFWQHQGNYVHAFFVYEENIHVPFIIYNKELFREPIIQEKITRHVDIVPTVLDILEIPTPKEMEGNSILSAHREQMAIMHTAWKDNIIGIRDGRWKYHYNFTQKTEELYDITRDPKEKINIAKQEPRITSRYRDIVYRNYAYRDAYFNNLLERKPRATAGNVKSPRQGALSPAQ